MFWLKAHSIIASPNIEFFLKRAGFTNIRTYVEDNVHIIAEGEKTSNNAKHDIKPVLKDRSIDH